MYGGAERNLERIISNSNISYELYYKYNFFSIFKSIFKCIRNNTKIILIPLGFSNTIFSRFLKIFFFKRIFLISSIRATEYQKSFFRIFIDLISSFLVDKWVSNSYAGKNLFKVRERINGDKINVIYNTLNFNKLSSVSNCNHKLNVINILLIGHIRKEKGYHKLPQLINLLNKSNLPFNLTLIGKGDLKSILKNQYNYVINYITHIDDSDDVTKHIIKNDILLNISDDEGVPSSFLECSVYNLPIIASNISGNNEYVWNYYNGILCDQNNLNSFVNAIFEISNNYSYYVKNAYNRFNIYIKNTTSDESLWRNIFLEN